MLVMMCVCVCVQMRLAVCVECIHTGRSMFTADKALLVKLRKTTGYTFINCKKALEKFNNDITQVRRERVCVRETVCVRVCVLLCESVFDVTSLMFVRTGSGEPDSHDVQC